MTPVTPSPVPRSLPERIAVGALILLVAAAVMWILGHTQRPWHPEAGVEIYTLKAAIVEIKQEMLLNRSAIKALEVQLSEHRAILLRIEDRLKR